MTKSIPEKLPEKFPKEVKEGSPSSEQEDPCDSCFLYGKIPGDTSCADVAILALARLDAMQAEELKRLASRCGPDSRVTTGPGCEHGPWRTFPEAVER